MLTVLAVPVEHQYIFTHTFLCAKIHLFLCIFSIFWSFSSLLSLTFELFSVFGGPYLKNSETDFYFLCRFWDLFWSSKTTIETIKKRNLMCEILLFFSKTMSFSRFLETTINWYITFFYCSNCISLQLLICKEN